MVQSGQIRMEVVRALCPPLGLQGRQRTERLRAQLRLQEDQLLRQRVGMMMRTCARGFEILVVQGDGYVVRQATDVAMTEGVQEFSHGCPW